MTKDSYSKASPIILKLNKVSSDLADLYNSELKINSESESKEYNLFSVKISKQQLLSIIKYNREVLTNEKISLEKMLSAI